MVSRWKTGPIKFYTSAGHVLTFAGDIRIEYDSNGLVIGYDSRGGGEWLLLPLVSECHAIERASVDAA